MAIGKARSNLKIYWDNRKALVKRYNELPPDIKNLIDEDVLEYCLYHNYTYGLGRLRYMLHVLHEFYEDIVDNNNAIGHIKKLLKIKSSTVNHTALHYIPNMTYLETDILNTNKPLKYYSKSSLYNFIIFLKERQNTIMNHVNLFYNIERDCDYMNDFSNEILQKSYLKITSIFG